MKKLARLTLENFQSHEFTEVEFSPGFNVIVGASDQGKSALIRALKWLFFNEPRGADFIRVGASGCRVTAVFTDGTRVARERTPSKNRYYLQLPGREEEVFEGFGYRVPREVQTALGVAKVKLDEDLEAALNLGEQLEAPFLLSETGAVKAKAIGRLYGVHIVDAALREVVRDISRAQQEEKRFRAQLDQVEESLKEYSDLPQLAAQVEKVRTRVAEVEALAQRLRTYRQLKQELAALEESIRLAEGVIDRLATLAQVDEVLERAALLALRADKLAEYRQELHKAQAELERAQGILAAAQNLDPVEALLAEAQDNYQRRVELADLYREKRRAEAVLARAEEIVHKTQGLERAVDLLAAYQETGNRIARLEELHQELRCTDANLAQTDKLARRAREDLKHRAAQYRALLEELGKCPVCFGDITPDITRRIIAEYTEEAEG